MRTARTTLLVLLTIVLWNLPASAGQISVEKRARIVELIELSGAKQFSTEFAKLQAQQLTPIFKKAYPTLSDDAVAVIMEEMIQATTDLQPIMVEETVKIYDRHFSEAELEDILAFYRTPTGMKSIRALPQIFQESVAFAQRLSQDMLKITLPRIEARIKELGYKAVRQ